VDFLIPSNPTERFRLNICPVLPFDYRILYGTVKIAWVKKSFDRENAVFMSVPLKMFLSILNNSF